MPVSAGPAIPGEGTCLRMKVGGTFIGIGNVFEIDGGGVKVVVVPTDHLCSKLITSRPGRLPDPDTISFKIWLDPNDTAMHLLILDRCNVPGIIDDFNIIFNDDKTTHAIAVFSGFFTMFKLTGMKNQENLEADLDIKITTLVQITPGTP